MERVAEATQLLLPADERRFERLGDPRRLGDDCEKPPRVQVVAEVDVLGTRCIGEEPARLLAEDDLVGAGTLLQVRGDVDRRAGDERLVSRSRRHDLAGVDRDADCKLDVPVA